MRRFLALAASALIVVSFATPAQSAGAKYSVYQKTLSAFSSTATTLTAQQKAQVKAAVDANPTAEKFICTGIRYYSQPMDVNIMVRKRAKAACEYAKQLNPNLSTWYQNKPTQARSFAGKVLLTVKTLEGGNPSSSWANRIQDRYKGGIWKPESKSYIKMPDSGVQLTASTLSTDFEACKIGNKAGMQLQTGFPVWNDSLRVPVEGTARIGIFSVDFIDAPAGSVKPHDIEKDLTANMAAWMDRFSNGKVNLEFVFPNEWITIPKSKKEFDHNSGVGEYAQNPIAGEAPSVRSRLEMATDMLEEIGKVHDINAVDTIFLMFPPSVDEERVGVYWWPAFNESDSWREPARTSHGNYATTVFASTRFGQFIKEPYWSWWLHELMHLQGASLHGPGNGTIFWVPASDDPTATIGSHWDFFRMGWLDQSRMACIDARSGVSRTLNIASYDNNAEDMTTVMVRVTDTDVVIIEPRRSTTANRIPDFMQGVTAYVATSNFTRNRNDSKAYELDQELGREVYFLDVDGADRSTLFLPDYNGQVRMNVIGYEGDSFSHQGLTIEVLEVGNIDQVRITRGSSAGTQNLPDQDGFIGELEFSLLSREPEDLKFCGCCGCFPRANLH
jgi:hypothetical protein